MPFYEKTGYLHENYRFFHLLTKKQQEFTCHYHDFHKVLLFQKGDVTYHIEGRAFHLLPGDVILIPAGEIHCPALNSDSLYERMILYLDPQFLVQAGQGTSLDQCFSHAHTCQSNVLRVPALYRNRISRICALIEEEQRQSESSSLPFAGGLYLNTLVTELLILLNRAAQNHTSIYPEDVCKDSKVQQILEYINQHLSEPLTIDKIASRFFISRYHLMHLFKESAGYTVGSYITVKRLLYARSLIQAGTPATQACYLSGFQNYSTFLRAYKKQFHTNQRNS